MCRRFGKNPKYTTTLALKQIVVKFSLTAAESPHWAEEKHRRALRELQMRAGGLLDGHHGVQALQWLFYSRQRSSLYDIQALLIQTRLLCSD
jgi:hypothetical protein